MLRHSVLLLGVIALYLGVSLAAPTDSGPTVKLDSGTFLGETDGDTDNYLGIPFAKPPCVQCLFLLVDALIELYSNPGLEIYASVFPLPMTLTVGCTTPGPLVFLALSRAPISRYQKGLSRTVSISS